MGETLVLRKHADHRPHSNVARNGPDSSRDPIVVNQSSRRHTEHFDPISPSRVKQDGVSTSAVQHQQDLERRAQLVEGIMSTLHSTRPYWSRNRVLHAAVQVEQPKLLANSNLTPDEGCLMVDDHPEHRRSIAPTRQEHVKSPGHLGVTCNNVRGQATTLDAIRVQPYMEKENTSMLSSGPWEEVNATGLQGGGDDSCFLEEQCRKRRLSSARLSSTKLETLHGVMHDSCNDTEERIASNVSVPSGAPSLPSLPIQDLKLRSSYDKIPNAPLQTDQQGLSFVDPTVNNGEGDYASQLLANCSFAPKEQCLEAVENVKRARTSARDRIDTCNSRHINRTHHAGNDHAHGTKEEAKQHALKLLQSRILLLDHAAKCDEELGECKLSSLCDSVKNLLAHMDTCDNRRDCHFAHCLSSRAVLAHDQQCNQSGCILCVSVKDLSRKSAWAHAKRAHKKRLLESQDLRRKKRESQGKPVAAPRKRETDKSKNGREKCAGLDEAGNDLGDITPGFFLRQNEAVKKRRMSEEDASATSQASPSLSSTASSAASCPDLSASCRSDESNGRPSDDALCSVQGGALLSSPCRSREDSLLSLNDAALSRDMAAYQKSANGWNDLRQEVLKVVPVMPTSDAVLHQARGHRRGRSEAMLEEIAISLRDTTRHPSFAKIQDMQTFLEEHGELINSPSLEDVSALVELWMGPDQASSGSDGTDSDGADEHFAMDDSLPAAFSF